MVRFEQEISMPPLAGLSSAAGSSGKLLRHVMRLQSRAL